MNLDSNTVADRPEFVECDEAHREIVLLFDIADEIAATIESAQAIHQDEQVEILEPLVNEVTDVADELSEGLSGLITAQDTKAYAKAFRVRPRFKRIVQAVNRCLEQIHMAPAEVAENVTTLVLPLVEKLVKQTEKAFGKLIAIVERARDLVKHREDFYAMVAHESYLATLLQNKNILPRAGISINYQR